MTNGGSDDFDMAAARAKFAKVNGSKTARKTRKKQAENAVDGRTLRSTGRTEHLNFKARPEIKAAIAVHVPKGKISLWLEKAIIAQFKAEAIDLDA